MTIESSSDSAPCWYLTGPKELHGSPFNRSRNWKALYSPAEAGAKLRFKPDEKVDAPAEKSHLFIKEYQNRTLRTEGLIGESINSAAYRLEKWNEAADKMRPDRPKDMGRWFSFSINKILALGDLSPLPPNKSATSTSPQPDRPAVAFSYLSGDSLQLTPLKPPTSTFEILNFAYGLAVAIQKLHNQGVAHSYLAPRNLIALAAAARRTIGHCEIAIVGFGYSKVSDLLAGKPGQNDEEGDLYFRAPECREPTAGSFWYPADIYSLGALLLDWILGRDKAKTVLENLPRDVRSLKSSIAWSLEDSDNSRKEYLSKNQNIAKIIDSCLRFDVEDRISCIEDLLDMIRTARHVDPRHHTRQPLKGGASRGKSGSTGKEPKAEAIKALREYSESRANPFQLLFSNEVVTRVTHELESVEANHIEIFGGRDRIISSLCNLLGAAKDGDEYCTLTLPDYWSDGNLGSNGRFLSMNKHAATQKVMIRRVYLVDRQFHELTESEQYILEQQVWNDAFWKVRVRVVGENDDEIASFEENGSTVAYLQRTESKKESKKVGTTTKPTHGDQDLNEYVALNFFSSADVTLHGGKPVVRRQIKKVRFWSPLNGKGSRSVISTTADEDFAQARWNRFQQHKEKFRKAFEGSVPIEEYILGPNGSAQPFEFTPDEFRKLISAPSGPQLSASHQSL
jgi:serine/threonine protein kinase